ncbi:hypothetical protein [Paenibacillus sp. URB8-2]|uniref:hypothetical protein n=1 Tax=Paenibacillus sp. URB8-2 TaxID=2741301 RepID=UPI0015BA0724|nr:hypothetical protein [Paenibacillus sp. URB8-2]
MQSWLLNAVEKMAYHPEEMKAIGLHFVMLILIVGLTLEVSISLYLHSRKGGV